MILSSCSDMSREKQVYLASSYQRKWALHGGVCEVSHLGSKGVCTRGFLLLSRLELRHLSLQEYLALLQLLPFGCLLAQRCDL